MIASPRPYLTSDSPLAFAHRGGSLEHPENTMASFTAAVELGYLHLETDTQITRDGVLLAFHDETLDRVTDLHGEVSDHTLAEVRRADAGYSFSIDGGRTHPFRGRGVTVPTLEEVLLAFPSTRFNIDAKQERVVAPLAALIDRLGAADRICIGSFRDARLRRFRRLSQRPGLHLDGPELDHRRPADLAGRADAGVRRRLRPGAHGPVGGAGRRPRIRPGGSPGRAAGPRLDHRRPPHHGAAARPRRGRDHVRPADPAPRGAPGARPVGRVGDGWPEGFEPSTS